MRFNSFIRSTRSNFGTTNCLKSLNSRLLGGVGDFGSAWYQPRDTQNPKILDEINNIHDYSWIMNHLNLFGTFLSVFEMNRWIFSTLRTKSQIKEVDSVTQIIKSHQKVSLRTILHVNIIIKSLRSSAIGYFLTIITSWPIESHQKITWFEKNHLISL